MAKFKGNPKYMKKKVRTKKGHQTTVYVLRSPSDKRKMKRPKARRSRPKDDKLGKFVALVFAVPRSKVPSIERSLGPRGPVGDITSSDAPYKPEGWVTYEINVDSRSDRKKAISIVEKNGGEFLLEEDFSPPDF